MTAKAERLLRTSIKKSTLAPEALNIIRIWLNEIEEFGPDVLNESAFWNVAAVKQNPPTFRIVCEVFRFAITYEVFDQEIFIVVEPFIVEPFINEK